LIKNPLAEGVEPRLAVAREIEVPQKGGGSCCRKSVAGCTKAQTGSRVREMAHRAAAMVLGAR